ncbi:MAG: hypothetical protein LQ339_000727 [Xanthoria mediterranea]|nr:MAG: hypothetical protein LQ339_000727 [Xanthoria mediterranea]
MADIPDDIVVACKVELDADVAPPPRMPLRLRQRRSIQPADGVNGVEGVVIGDTPDGIVVVWEVDVDADVAPPTRTPLRLRQRRSVHPAGGLVGTEGVVVVCKVDVGVELPPGLPLRLRQRRSVHLAAAVLDDPELDVVLGWPLIVLVLPKENEVADVVAELFELPDKLVDEFPAVLELPTSLGDMVAGVGDAIWLGVGLDNEFDVVAPPPLLPPNPKLRQSNPEQPALEACDEGEEELLLVEDVVVVGLLGGKVEVTVVTILPAIVTVLTEILKQAAPLH